MAKESENAITVNRAGSRERSIRIVNTNRVAQNSEQDTITKAEKLLLEAHPSWWNFFWYLFFSWLIIPLFIALWKRAGLKFYVYPDRVVLESPSPASRSADTRALATRANT